MIEPLTLLYVISLHTSMALMELFAWALALIALIPTVREKKFPRFPLLVPALGLFLCVLVGLIINPAGRGFIFQLGFLRWLILLYLLPQALKRIWSGKFEGRLVAVWTGILLLTALYALFQTFTGIDLIRPSAHVVAFEKGIYRPVGFFSRSLAFAYSFGFSFLAVSLPCWKNKSSLWTGTIFILGTLTVIATEARGAWLGLLAAIAFYLLIEHRRYLIVLAGTLFATIYLISFTHTELSIKVYNLVHMNLDHSSFLRTHIWQAYWTMFKENPFFGVGLLQGDLLVPGYYQKLGIQEDFVSNAHNVYLQWLAGAGVFALGFYLWICGYFLLRAWRLRKATPWGWSILLAQIFLHVGAFTENNFFTAITNHMLIFNWSILLACGEPPASPEKGRHIAR